MKVGDLVRVPKCGDIADCGCFFCHYDSNGIGIVKEEAEYRRGCQIWVVEFDCGEWDLANDEGEVISASR